MMMAIKRMVVVARGLHLQEYQSKKLMKACGATVQRFEVVGDDAEARAVAEGFVSKEYVIKAQILAGGRGKGIFTNGFKGGVHLTKNKDEVLKLVTNMLGERLITKQTKKEGILVTKVMVAEALDIARETYLALLMDRVSGGPVVVCSPRGGVDIEEVAASDPLAIHKEIIDIDKGITKEQGENIARHLNFTDRTQIDSVIKQVQGLYQLFLQYDCTQIEINPFGVTPDGTVVCFDAKLNFDDNAAYRQKEIFDLHDPAAEEQDPREVEAAQCGLNYIGLKGNIGCVVNGAGLAMATMDIVKLHGGTPANFLDLGGAVTVPQVERAFQILTSDTSIKSIFINIFGGIVNCATVAEGLVLACRNTGLTVPLIIRLEGTNVEAARKILMESGLKMKTSTDLDEAAHMAVNSFP